MRRFEADRRYAKTTLLACLLALILFLIFALSLVRILGYDIPRIAADLFQVIVSHLAADAKEKIFLCVAFFGVLGIEYVFLTHEDHEDARKKDEERDFLQSLPQRKQ